MGLILGAEEREDLHAKENASIVSAKDIGSESVLSER